MIAQTYQRSAWDHTAWMKLRDTDPDEAERQWQTQLKRWRDEARAFLARMTEAEAAHWMAKDLIRVYVARGETEDQLAQSHMGQGCAEGDVSIISGRKIEVTRVGPWPEGWDWRTQGHSHTPTYRFSLHAIFEEVKAEVAAPAVQASLWDALEVSA